MWRAIVGDREMTEGIGMAETIRINRAPTLTLWAAVVAEQLGFDREPP